MPSAARTIYRQAPTPTNTETPGIVSDQELAFPAKDPGQSLDFTIDYSQWLLDAGSDTIVAASVVIAITPDDLKATALSATPTALTWIFSGGTITEPATAYAITVTLTTAAGLVDQYTYWMPIEQLSPLNASSAYANGLISLAIINLLLNGAPLNTPPATGGVYLGGTSGGPYALYFMPYTGLPPGGAISLSALNSVLNSAPINAAPSQGGLYLAGSSGGPYAVYYAEAT